MSNSKHLKILICFWLTLVVCRQVKADVDSIPLQAILDINQFAYTLGNEHDAFYSFIGVRALAMCHLAAHDIINLNLQEYQQYHFSETPPKSLQINTALIAAVDRILNMAFPSRQDTLKFFTSMWLSNYASGSLDSASWNFGQQVADAYISLRKDDGHRRQGNYTPMTKPGDYQYTPGFDYVWKPDFSVARPFALERIDQFRAPPPPDFENCSYAAAYLEVQAYGSRQSKLRTEEQTHIGHWWAEFGEHSWNRIGRILASSMNMDANSTNRMFALINMNLYDFYLVTFESKYHYDTWRPITAIHHGLTDVEWAQADTTWVPEMTTPPWPEYPSAHAGVGGAGAVIMEHAFGSEDLPFNMISETAPEKNPNRSYRNIYQAARDCANSRVWNGYHFRFATEAGLKQGMEVARHTISKVLLPIAK